MKNTIGVLIAIILIYGSAYRIYHNVKFYPQIPWYSTSLPEPKNNEKVFVESHAFNGVNEPVLVVRHQNGEKTTIKESMKDYYRIKDGQIIVLEKTRIDWSGVILGITLLFLGFIVFVCFLMLASIGVG